MTRVRMRHLRQLGYCARGARRWFARRGWDWPRFLREGVAVERARASGDAMAERAADAAEREAR